MANNCHSFTNCKKTATHFSILTWKIPWTEEPGGYTPQGRNKSDAIEQLTLSLPTKNSAKMNKEILF